MPCKRLRGAVHGRDEGPRASRRRCRMVDAGCTAGSCPVRLAATAMRGSTAASRARRPSGAAKSPSWYFPCASSRASSGRESRGSGGNPDSGDRGTARAGRADELTVEAPPYFCRSHFRAGAARRHFETRDFLTGVALAIALAAGVGVPTAHVCRRIECGRKGCIVRARRGGGRSLPAPTGRQPRAPLLGDSERAPGGCCYRKGTT